MSYLRQEIESNANTEAEMFRGGWYLADRTLYVSINLLRSKLDYEKQIRLDVIETKGGGQYKKEILKIAQESFPDDRRFHVSIEPNQEIANSELENWCEKLGKTYVCLYKGAPIGFLAIENLNDDAIFVKLAAVGERFRATGGAMSLYSKAAFDAKKSGIKKMEGRISSKNTAVMNLYSFLGGVFSNPIDVFIKEN